MMSWIQNEQEFGMVYLKELLGDGSNQSSVTDGSRRRLKKIMPPPAAARRETRSLLHTRLPHTTHAMWGESLGGRTPSWRTEARLKKSETGRQTRSESSDSSVSVVRLVTDSPDSSRPHQYPPRVRGGVYGIAVQSSNFRIKSFKTATNHQNRKSEMATNCKM